MVDGVAEDSADGKAEAKAKAQAKGISQPDDGLDENEFHLSERYNTEVESRW